MRTIVISLAWIVSISCRAQVTNNIRAQYEQFKQQAHQEYADFRKKCNANYAEFLKKAWESYQAGPIIPQPKDDMGPPVIMSDEDREKPISPKPIPIDTIIKPVLDEPQPLPVSPIYEQTGPDYNVLTLKYFGTEAKVRVPKQNVNLFSDKFSMESMSDAWMALSEGGYDNLLRDCLEMRIRYGLCDWAYLLLLRDISEELYGGSNNSSTFFMAWAYCQTGYQMRLAVAENKLYMLMGSKHQIYNWSYYVLEGGYFYPFRHDRAEISNAQISDTSFPEEKPISLFMNETQAFAENYGNERVISSSQYPNVIGTVRINQNLMDFYSTYPTSQFGDNVASRWAMYANTPMAENVKKQLYPSLRQAINGKPQLEAINMLLNWVQTGFVYEYDDKIWGDDRAFFAEESLNYPYCDCEDRSILFTRIVRDLLGLKCILIFYPGHLACAVHFSDDVEGDYIMLESQKFIVTDPTYIGAPAGYTMPGMDNKTATVILLE